MLKIATSAAEVADWDLKAEQNNGNFLRFEMEMKSLASRAHTMSLLSAYVHSM